MSQALPWLELAALHSEEAERKERVRRLQLQKDAVEGKGFGPAPKTVAKPYVSAYAKTSSTAGTRTGYRVRWLTYTGRKLKRDKGMEVISLLTSKLCLY